MAPNGCENRYCEILTSSFENISGIGVLVQQWGSFSPVLGNGGYLLQRPAQTSDCTHHPYSAVNLLCWMWWGAAVIFLIAWEAQIWDFDAVFTLVVLVLLRVILHYSSSFLISFRALPSTDLTGCSSPLLALPGHHSCVVTVLSSVNFWLLFLLLCFLSFSPSYK